MTANSDQTDEEFPKPIFENSTYEIPWPVAVGRPSVLGFLWEYRKYKEHAGVPSEKVGQLLSIGLGSYFFDS